MAVDRFGFEHGRNHASTGHLHTATPFHSPSRSVPRKRLNPLCFLRHSRLAEISGLFIINIQGSQRICVMSIYISFAFYNILGYPAKIVTLFFTLPPRRI